MFGGKILDQSWAIVLICSATICLAGAQDWLADRIIPPNYDSNKAPLRPYVDGGTILVNGSMVINSFAAAYDQWSLHTDLFLCLHWHDYRLVDINPVLINSSTGQRVHYTSVKVRQFAQFWLPKVYFRNGLSVSTVDSLNDIQYLEVWPTTKMVRWCNRLNVHSTCHFNLSNFPFDAQICYLELEYFSGLKEDMRVKLSSVVAHTGGNYQFRLHHVWNGTCPLLSLDPFSEVRLLNVQSCAFVAMRLVRHLGYYVIRYYAPTFLCLATSMTSFWVATNGWPARIIYTCVVYLTVKTISQTAYDEVPANDVVSLFWWLWGIQFFVYMNLIEYAVALAWVQFAEDKKRARDAGVESPDGYYFGKNGWFKRASEFIEMCLFKVFGPIDFYRDTAGRNKVDYFARVVYPFFMFLFVSIYMVATIPAWVRIYNWQHEPEVISNTGS